MVVSFTNFRPGVRYDSLPWTNVKVSQSMSRTGPWTEIDSLALSPLDADPTHPQSRSFTTEHATISAGWFLITFVDGNGDTQDADPIYYPAGGAPRIGSSYIREWSKVNFPEYGYPASSSADDKLDVLVRRGKAYVEQISGRLLDETLPSTLIEAAEEAVQMRVEQKVLQTQEDYVETGADDQVESFSAGGYSETRAPSGTRVTRGGGVQGYPLVNPWPALNQLLWLLMTEERTDYWRWFLTGQVNPAWDSSEVDWGMTTPDTGVPSLDIPDPGRW